MKPKKREKWSQVIFEVKIRHEDSFFECEFGLFEHMGVICRHALKVREFNFFVCVQY